MRPEKAVIYLIISPTGKTYVGQTRRLIKRKSSYKKLQNSGNMAQPFISRSIIKHGWDSHSFQILMEFSADVTQATLDFWEIFFIKIFKESTESMNCREGGVNGKHSPKTVSKMSKSMIGRFVGDKHPMWGKKRPELREAMLGNKRGANKVLSEAARQKISEANKGKPKPKSQAFRDAVSKTMKGRTPANINLLREKSLKPVYQVDITTGNILNRWDSMSLAANAVGLKSASSITAVLRGKVKSSAGYFWKYA